MEYTNQCAVIATYPISGEQAGHSPQNTSTKDIKVINHPYIRWMNLEFYIKKKKRTGEHQNNGILKGNSFPQARIC